MTSETLDLPAWQPLHGLPPHAKFISSRKGKFLYRELPEQGGRSGHWWQVITEDFTLYPGHWPDVSCSSLEEAKGYADAAWTAHQGEE